MSNLVFEVLLRLAKVAAATGLGTVIYVIVIGLLGAPGSAELALLCWLSGAALILLVETGPI
jgi:hypothetical protein